MTSHQESTAQVAVRHSDFLVTSDLVTVRYTSPVDARYALQDLGVPFEQAATMVLIATLDAQWKNGALV
jgi:hypothetical protein